MLDRTESSKLVVGIKLLEFIGNGSEFVSLNWLGTWKGLARDLGGGGGRLELLSGRIIDESLLWLIGNSWPQNQLILVGIQSLHIKLKCIVVGIGSSVVDSDSDGSCEASAQSGS